jgi:aminoglycoside 6'-N-acetyltransferase
MDSSKISFRPITKADVPNLVRWQSDDEVAEWYWDLRDEPEEVLIQSWVERVTGSGDKANRYIITVDGEDIGEIQDYLLADFPADAEEVGISDAAGVDLFIGEPTWRDRGVGTAVLAKFVDEIVFGRRGVNTCIIDPEPSNRRAIRCYEKVGFRHVRSYHSVENNVDVYLMRLDRPQA